MIMLHYLKLYGTKLDQKYKLDCLEQMALIMTMNLELNNKKRFEMSIKNEYLSFT